ncbi:MAG TPA: hypothetical protein VEV87_08280 [Chitinophagaceae bacterium]|nr:hypothetical protein [Chitinophagaceae bacterium]
MKTRLTIDYYIDGNVLNQLMFTLTRKSKIKSMLQKSMENLVPLVKEIQLPTPQPPKGEVFEVPK